MNHRFFARTAIAIAATAITSLGVTAASAQTTTGSNPHAGPATAKYVKSTVKPRLLCDTIAPPSASSPATSIQCLRLTPSP